jgi:hypothetical protein
VQLLLYLRVRFCPPLFGLGYDLCGTDLKLLALRVSDEIFLSSRAQGFKLAALFLTLVCEEQTLLNTNHNSIVFAIKLKITTAKLDRKNDKGRFFRFP